MSMTLVRAIVRPEKADEVLASLAEVGFSAVTKIPVFGRGKQRGLKVGDINYDELPKELLMMVVPTTDKDLVIKTVISSAKTGAGAFGDGKVFVSPVDEVYTISSGTQDA